MSRIDDLIAKYCPNGVEYKTLGELGKFMRGGGPQKKHLLDLGKPCIHYGQIYTRYGLYTGETLSFVAPEVFDSSRKASPGDVIIADTSENDEDLAKSIAWVGNEEVAVSNHTLIYSSPLNPKYVSYFLSSHSFQKQKRRHITGVKVRSISENGMSKIKIPVPPLEVQEEIVRILDSFTQLEAELEAELEARRKQYEYYRDSLLSFENLNNRVGEGVVRLLPLAEVFDLKAGKNKAAKFISRTRTLDHTVPCYGGNGIRGFVQDYNQDSEIVLIGRQGALSGNVHYSSGRIYATEHAVVVTPKSDINMRFAYYLLTVANLNQYVTKSAQPGLSVRRLNTVPVPVPPLSEQERIVAILDKFDALVNDLSSGLPAEIEARRKQYEYYRDQLLTFTPAK